MSQPQSQQPMIDQRNISLLWAGPEDALEISKMHAGTQRHEWSENSVHELLVNPCSSALMLKIRLVENQHPVPVGYVMGQLAGDEVEILSIGVLTPFQRFGLGRQLVEGLIRAAHRAEAQRITLEVGVDNPPAIALYESLGFTEVGRRMAYYKTPNGTDVDAIIMARDV